MRYPTCDPLVSNLFEIKLSTILISITLFFLPIPCARKVPFSVGSAIKYVLSEGEGEGGPTKSVLARIGGGQEVEL